MPIRRLGVVFVLAMSAAAQRIPAPTGEDIEKGKLLFQVCSRCHGPDGGGGDGPNLTRSVTRDKDDQTLLGIIRDGIPDRGMPGFQQFTNVELRSLVSYLRSLGRIAAVASLQGDAEKGKLVYQKLGCSSCHTIAGDGGTFGPELTNIGTRRAPDYLLQAIVEPTAALPRGVMAVPGRGLNEFLPVRVVTRDGREITGIRVNEDSFTIQLKNISGELFSFRKDGLRQLDKEVGKSLMPDYRGKLSGTELNDLVAYLFRLGG
jgi:cytochrome c oxidase cbb3-type subunit III